MKKLVFLSFLNISLNCLSQSPSTNPHYELVWEDNFNLLNTSIWSIDNFTGGIAPNGNSVIKLSNNVKFENGNLVINTNNVPYYYDGNTSGGVYNSAGGLAIQGLYKYNTGSIESKMPYNHKYGYIESKIKIDFFAGMFPGFWTFIGDGIVGQNSAEIDIFEILGNVFPPTLSTNIHLTYNVPDIYFKVHNVKDFDFTNWNTYALEWSPELIKWYLNGELIRQETNPGIVDFTRIIFNNSIHPGFNYTYNQTFSKNMYIDYLKVYKIKPDCNNNLEFCNSDYTQYDNRVKKNITFGNGICSNNINSNFIFQAKEFILLKENFSVPLNTEFTINTTGCY